MSTRWGDSDSDEDLGIVPRRRALMRRNRALNAKIDDSEGRYGPVDVSVAADAITRTFEIVMADTTFFVLLGMVPLAQSMNVLTMRMVRKLLSRECRACSLVRLVF
jgi:hypothetical protein